MILIISQMAIEVLLISCFLYHPAIHLLELTDNPRVAVQYF